ncbi:hypothetical protein OQA88_9867 [Cercophora sp. LCS_1]
MPHSISEASPPADVKMEEQEIADQLEDVDMADAASPAAEESGGQGKEAEGVKGENKEEQPQKESVSTKLEDLFDDMDSDDDEEFPSSRPGAGKQPSSSPEALPDIGTSGPGASNTEVLPIFYQRLFPWRYFFQWLNHGPQPTTDFEHREFVFTLQNDAWMRYNSYRTADLLRKDVLRLKPTRIDIGPVYSTNPRDRKLLHNVAGFRPVSKELCFDIDLTDYDDIRTCCDKANICHKCWRFMTMAIKVITSALRDDFGFKHIIWVYSGRRGVHCWVSDKEARNMDDSKRRVIAGYLEIITGGAQGGKRVNLRRPLHPHISRSLDVLRSHFQEDILEGQDPWRSQERADNLLQFLPDKDLREALRRKWESSPGRASTLKWADIDAVAKASASKNFDSKALLDAKQDIVLEYTYPRLDIKVTKRLDHLLKSPFVIHPGTGRVCVPIDTSSTELIESFDPLEVPTVQSLIQEIDAWVEPEVKPEKPIHDWEKTSLKPYIEYFRDHVNAVLRDERDGKVKRERGDDDEVW